MQPDLRSQGGRGRVLVALDPSTGVRAASFAAAWSGDAEAQRIGDGAAVIPAPGAVFIPGVVELVAIPLAVNLGSSALYDVVKRLLDGSRRAGRRRVDDLEIAETLSADGERLLVVRSKGDGR